MTAETGMQLILRVGRELKLPEDFLSTTIHALIKFGGIDSQQLRPAEVFAGIEDRNDAPWGELWWSFNETIGYFEMLKNRDDWTGNTKAMMFIYGVVISHALRRGHGDTDFIFDKLCATVAASGRCDPLMRMPVELRMDLMRYVLSQLSRT
jgi:hypothetical protein